MGTILESAMALNLLNRTLYASARYYTCLQDIAKWKCDQIAVKECLVTRKDRSGGRQVAKSWLTDSEVKEISYTVNVTKSAKLCGTRYNRMARLDGVSLASEM